ESKIQNGILIKQPQIKPLIIPYRNGFVRRFEKSER
ncbi:unnamed protein product, partial [marine sediment metagenome]